MFQKKRNTFHGGVHPYEGKELSKDKPIVKAQPGNLLYYAVSQHIGAPAVPTVQKGDHVKAGQKIAEAGGFVSAPVYASVSGMVKGIEKKVSAAGSPSAIDHILVNGAECEPYLTSDYRRMLEEPEKVIGGLKIMLHMFPRAKGVICIEDNKPDCIAKFRELVLPEDNIEVLELKTKYPQGAERMLIYAATGRKVNSSMLPADAGCIVDNIDTVTAIYQAVRFGEPLMSRIVTVTGDAVQNPCNFEVPVGMLLSELLEQAGGLKNEAVKIICGGPMMGKALFTMDVPVTKTTSALTCLTEDEVSALAPSACINCGRCVSVCPGQILPARLSVFAEHGEEEKFLKYGGMECCACGCCSFICPARRPLTQEISSMRKVLLAKRKKK